MKKANEAFWLRALWARLSLEKAQTLLQAGLDERADVPALRRYGLTAAQAARFAADEAVSTAMRWLDGGENRWMIAWSDDRYPALLREIADPPPALMGVGDASLLNGPQLAVVGARHATREGLRHAEDFASAVSAAGVTIASGLAHGIDAAAHRGGLKGAGGTVAVIGTGVDRVYPAAHRALAGEIAERGAMISPFPLGTPPQAANFPQRNRIVSGLSLGVLVVEAAAKSGSLITARLAMEQGREVFAIPGSLHNPMARGCHRLIRQGARLVETAAEILEELAPHLQHTLALSATAREMEARPASADRAGAALPEPQRRVLDALEYAPMALDRLAQSVGLPATALQSALMALELEGLVEKLPGGFYKRIS